MINEDLLSPLEEEDAKVHDTYSYQAGVSDFGCPLRIGRGDRRSSAKQYHTIERKTGTEKFDARAAIAPFV